MLGEDMADLDWVNTGLMLCRSADPWVRSLWSKACASLVGLGVGGGPLLSESSRVIGIRHQVVSKFFDQAMFIQANDTTLLVLCVFLRAAGGKRT